MRFFPQGSKPQEAAKECWMMFSRWKCGIQPFSVLASWIVPPTRVGLSLQEVAEIFVWLGSLRPNYNPLDPSSDSFGAVLFWKFLIFAIVQKQLKRSLTFTEKRFWQKKNHCFDKKEESLSTHFDRRASTMLPIRRHWWESSISSILIGNKWIWSDANVLNLVWEVAWWVASISRRYSTLLRQIQEKKMNHWLIEHQNKKKRIIDSLNIPVDNVDKVADPRTLMRIIHFPEILI